ncbi:MAG: FkbM family methyltransferase [Verrucomicrobiota bacterium]|nr:FkbM family methyltransferase [Verrucomicrobiota bacterium]
MKNRILSGEYETAEIEMCKRHFRPEERVLELGAAIGYVSLFCQIHLSIQDYAVVEANPNTTRMLLENYRLNNKYPNLITAALDRQDGTTELSLNPDFWADSLVNAHLSQNPCITVPSLTLSSILSKLPFRPSTLLIDIEGSEIHLGEEVIPAEVTKIVCELHPELLGVKAAFKVISDFFKQGFQIIDNQSQVYVLAR